MTENGTDFDEEMASLYITSTCQLIPKSVSTVSQHMRNLFNASTPVPSLYLIPCGSTEEFYIRPLYSSIGDADALICEVHVLAFRDYFPVLPSDLSGLVDTIQCYQIESYQKYPGFVRILVLGEMNYNWKCKKYQTNYGPKSNTGQYLELNIPTFYVNFVSGPAVKTHSGRGVSHDSVNCVFCPQWPREAQNWPIRKRKHGWPATDAISAIVENGCHAVYAQHRSCRQDRQQWRLSFSAPEVILLQSWSYTQQIVYHLLRFFAKRELIQKNCPKEDEVLCPYHLKTLMLWTCEEMPPDWWNTSSVIAVCCELLKRLLEWLKRRHFPNYFIPQANLFHNQSSCTIIEKTERRIGEFCNSRILSQWFIDNYILPVIQTYFKVNGAPGVTPHFISSLLPLLKLRKALLLQSLDIVFSLKLKNSHQMCLTAIKFEPRTSYYPTLPPAYNATFIQPEGKLSFDVIPTMENVLCFTYFDKVVFILHFAYRCSRGGISLDSSLFVELINNISMQPKILKCLYHNFPKTYKTQSGRFQFLRALEFMQNLTGSNSRSEFRLLSLVSKEYLRKALQYDDSQLNDIAPAASTYLAALHFTSSEYQEAIRFCSAVILDETSQKDNEILNAGCLLFIDDVVRIVGLCVLQKKITNRLRYIGRRLYLDLRISQNVFAYYLNALSVKRIFNRLNCYDDTPRSAFALDEYLIALMKQKYIISMKSGAHFRAAGHIVYRQADYLTETETNKNALITKETVIGSLVEIALENMSLFYDVIRKDFAIECNTADCYRALYLYKCRHGNECLNLCERILHEPDLHSDLQKFSFVNVLAIPSLEYLFDEDIQALLGLQALIYSLLPRKDGMQKVKGGNEAFAVDILGHWFETNCVHSLRIGLSTVRLRRYLIKYQYFLGRHFLARYLKVRCCVDFNLPFKAATTEFAAQKANLPLEYIIRMFLLQKLRWVHL